MQNPQPPCQLKKSNSVKYHDGRRPTTLTRSLSVGAAARKNGYHPKLFPFEIIYIPRVQISLPLRATICTVKFALCFCGRVQIYKIKSLSYQKPEI
eukprot:sb/3479147/